ncbi:MAG TPA: hypothetical protein VMR41_01005 [Patescibacteria group bacterium]|nr:hypothetical protein [Patescibacteria group bacterium]
MIENEPNKEIHSGGYIFIPELGLYVSQHVSDGNITAASCHINAPTVLQLLLHSPNFASQ